jgi:hypothetical protein
MDGSIITKDMEEEIKYINGKIEKNLELVRIAELSALGPNKLAIKKLGEERIVLNRILAKLYY